MLEQFNFELKYSRVNGHNVTFRYLILLIGLSKNCLACHLTDCFVRSLRVYHRAGQKLELNITRPFLETSMDVVEVWKDDSFEEENAKSIEHHAYYIKNETGQVRPFGMPPPRLLFACMLACTATHGFHNATENVVLAIGRQERDRGGEGRREADAHLLPPPQAATVRQRWCFV